MVHHKDSAERTEGLAMSQPVLVRQEPERRFVVGSLASRGN
jgi:hypothetical protein